MRQSVYQNVFIDIVEQDTDFKEDREMLKFNGHDLCLLHSWMTGILPQAHDQFHRYVSSRVLHCLRMYQFLMPNGVGIPQNPTHVVLRQQTLHLFWPCFKQYSSAKQYLCGHTAISYGSKLRIAGHRRISTTFYNSQNIVQNARLYLFIFDIIKLIKPFIQI